jgi:hypothetical protein
MQYFEYPFMETVLLTVVHHLNTLTYEKWVIVHVPYYLSAITIYMTLLQGAKKPSAWLVGLANQVLWLYWMTVSKNYGFLPLNAMLWWVYWKNYKLWKKES